MGAGAYGDGTPIVGDDEGGTEAGKGHGTHPFEVWLNQHYTNREDMNKELESLAVNITKEINEKTAAHKGLMVNIVEAAVGRMYFCSLILCVCLSLSVAFCLSVFLLESKGGCIHNLTFWPRILDVAYC